MWAATTDAHRQGAGESTAVTPLSPPLQVLDPDSAADHLTRLRRLAVALSGSPEIADDVIQETYARVLSRPRELRGESDYSYLAGTLRNVLSDHWRGERRRLRLVGAPPVRHGDPEAAARAGELYAALADLPERSRAVVAAVDVAGLSYAEAARELGIPVGTVMSRLHRARARLAGTLAEAA
jgi:RNA polymerase sigma-70 factor, ECF subfamily